MMLTDEELQILEQLTYLNNDVAKAAGINGGVSFDNDDHISDILSEFDDEALRELENNKNPIGLGGATGPEWSSIIRYLKSSKMKDLVLSDTMKDNTGRDMALCFTDSENPDDAIVAFRGTVAENKEWEDNVEGLNVADTRCQKEALDYIEHLKYSNITAVGHSKGANKSMYVTIMSDKVKRCVAMDGQGFSQKFIDAHWAEIQEKGHLITNYSVNTDYVHVLLFPVPNSNQVYCKGYDMGHKINDAAQHHSPNSFFVTDMDGNLILDAEGNPIIVITEEDESATMLHKFTTFILNNATETDKVKIVDYISVLLSMAFGEKASKDEVIDFVLSDPDSLALVLAYLVKYMDEYDLDADDVDKLLEMLGLNNLNELINLKHFDVDLFGFEGTVDINLNLANILNYAKKQLTDNNSDLILRKIVLPALKKIKFDDYNIDISELWSKIDKKVKDIDVTDKSDQPHVRKGNIREFTCEIYDAIMKVADKITTSTISVSDWSNYSGEEWYSSLLISSAVRAINAYFSKIGSLNNKCKADIKMIFDSVGVIDVKRSKNISIQVANLKQIETKIKSVSNRM